MTCGRQFTAMKRKMSRADLIQSFFSLQGETEEPPGFENPSIIFKGRVMNVEQNF